jgi:hypothetical protein
VRRWPARKHSLRGARGSRTTAATTTLPACHSWRSAAAAATPRARRHQIGTVPVYAGLTLAGVLATTAHGSGYKAPSAIWDTLLEVMWVDGTGKVRGPDTRARSSSRVAARVCVELVPRLQAWLLQARVGCVAGRRPRGDDTSWHRLTRLVRLPLAASHGCTGARVQADRP